MLYLSRIIIYVYKGTCDILVENSSYFDDADDDIDDDAEEKMDEKDDLVDVGSVASSNFLHHIKNFTQKKLKPMMKLLL
jgi:hypothetical protein